MTIRENKLVLFQSREIRRLWHEDEWVFSVIDVVAVLTDSVNPRDYWYKMKIRVKGEEGFEPSTVCRQLKMQAPDGFDGNRGVAKRGGRVAGNARKEAEKELGRSVVSKDSFLDIDQARKLDDES